MRVLVTGWFSFLHGEATAGDVLALDAVTAALSAAAIRHDVAWSPVFRPGELTLDEAGPDLYTHVVFVCGPLHGDAVRGLHERYAACRRIAVGVSVIDPGDPAVTGFHLVLARDAPDAPDAEVSAPAPASAPAAATTAADSAAGGTVAHRVRHDLAAGPARALARRPLPVAGVVLAQGQGEYGARRRHEEVRERLTGWLGGLECARLELDTRLDRTDWRLCSTAAEFLSIVGRLDVVVTTRLHGMVLALSSGVPALAVDPVAGGGKLTAQARAWHWPAILPADTGERDLHETWAWCLSGEGRRAAKAAGDRPPGGTPGHLPHALVRELVRDTSV